MRTNASFALLVALSLSLPDAFAQDAPFKIVANTPNPVTALPRAQLSQMFMKKVAVWPDGQKVLPVDQAESSPIRKAFSSQVHRQDTSVVKAYWLRQVFSGRLIPPAEVSSDAEVLTFVKANAGAIGYVSASTPTGSVKVVGLSEER